MLSTAVLFVSSCITFALGTVTQTNITITTGQPWDGGDDLIQQDKMLVSIRRPRDCQDLIQQGKTYEGHYVVYLEGSDDAPNKVGMVYCSQIDGMKPLPNEREPARNCLDLLNDGMTSSGPNVIYPYSEHPDDPVVVYCDHDTDGGGWTVIQNRFDGSVDFYRTWADYSEGFGNIAEEHYLGNGNIAALTGQCVNELRVDLEAWDGETAYAHYQVFHIDDGRYDYELEVYLYNGTAGDSLFYHAKEAFSTYDVNHDTSDRNCAEEHHGAWWYHACEVSNLNGRYYPRAEHSMDSMHWEGFRGKASLKASTMKVRPHSFTIAHTGGRHDAHEDGAH